MAWEWSHTTEAYDSARTNLGKLSKAELIVILGEWQYHDKEQSAIRANADAFDRDDLDFEAVQPTLEDFNVPATVRRLPKDLLVDQIWDRMEQYRTCDTGGFHAYCCPDGCHTVSFGK